MFVLALATVVFAHSLSAAVPDAVFLLIGQSNMVGRAALEPQDQKPVEGCLLWNGLSWEPARAPFNRYSKHKNRKSAGLESGPSFVRAYRLAHPDETVGIVCWARGGSSLEQWHPDHDEPWDLYDEAVRQTHAALAEDGALKGILWHQGEANSQRSDAYPQLLKRTLIDSVLSSQRPNFRSCLVRSVLGAPNMPNSIE